MAQVPLASCSRLGNDSVVWILLDNGADVGGIGKSGRTALQEAAKWGKTECARVLLEFMKNKKILTDNIDAVSEEDGGRTALHLAVYFGHIDAARLLCEFDADPTVEGDDGKTALAVGLLYRSARQEINDMLVAYYKTKWRRKVQMFVQLVCLRTVLDRDVASVVGEFLCADDRSVTSFEETKPQGMNI